MIGYLEGKCVDYRNDSVVVLVGGIGYKTYLTKEDLEITKKEGGATASFWAYLSVKENALDLYGFIQKENLDFFELLIGVSGIGPKSALAILNIAPTKSLKAAVSSGDPEHLTKTTGIGLKKAEKIILELRDKLEFADGDITTHQSSEDIIDALRALGCARGR